jgi:hypothetical protein
LSIQVDPGSYPKYSVPLHLRLPADSAAGDATATSRDSLLDDMAAFPSPTPSEIAKAAPESPSVEPGGLVRLTVSSVFASQAGSGALERLL